LRGNWEKKIISMALGESPSQATTRRTLAVLRRGLGWALVAHGCVNLFLLGVFPVLEPVTDVRRILNQSPLTLQVLLPQLGESNDSVAVRAAAFLHVLCGVARIAAGLSASVSTATYAAVSYAVEMAWIFTEVSLYGTIASGDTVNTVVMPLLVLLLAGLLVLRVDDTTCEFVEEPEECSGVDTPPKRSLKDAAAKPKIS